MSRISKTRKQLEYSRQRTKSKKIKAIRKQETSKAIGKIIKLRQELSRASKTFRMNLTNENLLNLLRIEKKILKTEVNLLKKRGKDKHGVKYNEELTIIRTRQKEINSQILKIEKLSQKKRVLTEHDAQLNEYYKKYYHKRRKTK